MGVSTTVSGLAAETSDHLFLRAARGDRTERTPIWLMRQAGRTDPEYNAIKTESGLALHDLFRHAEIAARISLLPQRFGVDAIIYFQDILTPLAPMGAEFVFTPGPMLVQSIRDVVDLDRLHTYDIGEELPFVSETIRVVRRELGGALPVLGFAGAPLTLLFFILEEGSFGARADKAIVFLRDYPDVARRLLDKLTGMTVDYLKLQIDAGANAVQLFESAANLLTSTQYTDWALPYQQRIFNSIRGLVPTIVFARGWANAEQLHDSGADILSLSDRLTISAVRAALGEGQVVQGNLDNRLLATGSSDQIADAARACIAEGGHQGHIFNLNHGLLRETPFENVVHLIDVVKSARISAATG